MTYLHTGNAYLTVADQEMAYRELGRGQSSLPLLMLPHLAATMDNWDPKLIDLLAQSQHLILVDLPGVGASQGRVGATISEMAEQAIRFVQTLGHERINLLGLSMCGMVAQEMVRQEPSLVNRLILAGTGHRGGVEIDKVTGKTFRYMAKAALEGIDPKRYIFYPHDEAGRQVADQVLGRMAERPATFADKPMSVPGFLTQLRAIKSWGRDPEDDLSHITQPTLIVNGDKDMQVPTENSYIMHQRISDSQLIIYPQAGHGSIFQEAQAFAEAANSFLAN